MLKKNTWRTYFRRQKVLISVLLLACVLFLTAFRFEGSSDLYLSRFDLALCFEKILDSSGYIVDQDFETTRFVDLSNDEHQKLARVIGLNLISGFYDRSFRPNERLRNVELVQYLRRLDYLLRSINANNFAARKLTRIFSYNNGPADVLSIPSRLPPQFHVAGDFVEKKVAESFFSRISEPDNVKFIIEGIVKDSIDLKPIAKAFVASSGRATKTAPDGTFRLEISDSATAEPLILSAADNYSSLEIRKDLSISNFVEFRLTPERSN